MNKRIKAYFLFGLLIVLCIVLIAFALPKAKLPSAAIPTPEPPPSASQTQIMENDPPTEPDPFAGGGAAKILNLNFLPPADFSQAVEKNTNASLIDANDKFLLFSTYGQFTYLYDLKSGSKTVIEREVKNAVLTQDGNYVLYLYEYYTGMPQLYAYDIALKQKELLADLPQNSEIKSIVYDNGRVLYSYKLPPKNQYASPAEKDVFGAELYVLKSFVNKYKPSQLSFKTNETNGLIGVSSGNLYAYTPSNHSISWIQPGLVMSPKYTVPLDPANERVASFKVNEAGDWLAVVAKNDSSPSFAATSSGKLENLSFDNIAWFDNTRLLILNQSSLYLYDVKTKQKSIFKNNVDDFFVYKNDIWISRGESLVKIAKSE